MAGCLFKGCPYEGCSLTIFDILDSNDETVGFIKKSSYISILEKREEFYSTTGDYL
jgi:hypothetical protein